jgi:CRISPR/Cas system-associated protein Cas7 (RAMP superfamily)
VDHCRPLQYIAAAEVTSVSASASIPKPTTEGLAHWKQLSMAQQAATESMLSLNVVCRINMDLKTKAMTEESTMEKKQSKSQFTVIRSQHFKKIRSNSTSTYQVGK